MVAAALRSAAGLHRGWRAYRWWLNGARSHTAWAGRTQPPMGFEKLQHLLREKLQQRTKSGNPVRQAFRHFEKNADMEITEDGLRKVRADL